MASLGRGRVRSLKVRFAIAGACLGIASGFGTLAWQHHGGTVLAQTSGGQQIDARVTHAFGIRFAWATSEQARPILPSGAMALSMDQAIAVAARNSVAARAGTILPNVQVVARYGTFSDDQYGSRSPGGSLQPYFQNRPAWFVTFSGPGVVMLLHGPEGFVKAHGGTEPAHHEQTVVVDAASEQYLEAYSYQ